MDDEKAIRALEERLKQLRELVEKSRTSLDLETRFAIRHIEYEAEKSRNIANEALAEIRHLDEQVRRLTDGE